MIHHTIRCDANSCLQPIDKSYLNIRWFGIEGAPTYSAQACSWECALQVLGHNGPPMKGEIRIEFTSVYV